MKKLALVLSCCSLALSATTVSATGVYVSGQLGFSLLPTLTVESTWDGGSWSENLSTDTGLAIGGAIGYDFDSFRAEAEVGFQQNDLDTSDWTENDGGESSSGSESFIDGDISSTSFFANGYYDIKNSSAFTPYIGAGIGYINVEINDAQVDIGDTPYSNDDSAFAYQFMLGASYAFNKNFSLDLSYRYVGTSGLELEDEGDIDDFEYSSHNFMLGCRYTF